MRPALLNMTEKTGGSIKDYLDLVHHNIVAEPSRVGIPKYPCGWCSEELRVACTCETARRLKMSYDGQSRTQVPTKRAESAQGREARDPDRNVRVRVSDGERKDLLKKGLCFGCKETWTRDHCCKEKALQAAMIPTVISTETREEDHWDSLDRAVMGASVAQIGEQEQVARRVTGTLTLNGKNARAFT